MNFQIFENKEFGQVRTIEIGGEVWFVGIDVATVFGFKNPNDALKNHVDERDKNTIALREGNRGNPNVIIINESGFYSLALASPLPQAKKIKYWVTSKVLPAIRQTGSYSISGKSNIRLDELSKRVERLEYDALQRRIEALESEKMCDEYLECKSVQQLPKHLKAALDSLIEQNVRLGFIMDFLDNNNVWLPVRALKQYIRMKG